LVMSFGLTNAPGLSLLNAMMRAHDK
jgi:hypothetical protein